MGFGSVAKLARGWVVVIGAGALVLSAPVAAQIENIDPNSGLDGSAPAGSYPERSAPGMEYPPAQEPGTIPALPAEAPPTSDNAAIPREQGRSATYKRDDLIGAAEGVFGKGAEGLARLIQDILGKQGEPNGYIVGREAGGAVVVGVRYGSGTLYHKVEGERPVYWTGPSIGFDLGANAGKTFVLVYNLDDSEDLYKRFPAGEGQMYFVGGFNASYLRQGHTVLIPIRLGLGVRMGVNAGYMKFSRTQKWLPF